jgi:signal peptidase I
MMHDTPDEREGPVVEPGTTVPDGAGADRTDGEPAGRRGDGSIAAFFRELPVLLLVAFVLAFLLRTFVIQVFYIPSESMDPTLQLNDRMVVEKLTYHFREPRRGEVVVFEGERSAVEIEQDAGARVLRGIGQFLGVVPANARDFVKRVIGLPGDTIRIEEGRVYVNDVPIDEPYVVHDDTGTHGPYEVPEGKLFFLGDNRPNSSDSRYTLGFVDVEAVVGRAAFIIWPLDHIDGLGGADYGRLERAGDAPAGEDTPRDTGESDAA